MTKKKVFHFPLYRKWKKEIDNYYDMQIALLAINLIRFKMKFSIEEKAKKKKMKHFFPPNFYIYVRKYHDKYKLF